MTEEFAGGANENCSYATHHSPFANVHVRLQSLPWKRRQLHQLIMKEHDALDNLIHVLQDCPSQCN